MEAPFNCIKGNYDFKWEAVDRSNVIYEDLSDWMVAPGYELPEYFDIDVLKPGHSGFSTITVKAGGTTRITPQDLDSNAAYLSDGIYTLSVTNCGTTYTRTAALTAHLDCMLDRYRSTLTIDDDFQDLLNIETLIGMVHTNARLKKTKSAMFYYQEAQRAIQRLNCDCTCPN